MTNKVTAPATVVAAPINVTAIVAKVTVTPAAVTNANKVNTQPCTVPALDGSGKVMKQYEASIGTALYQFPLTYLAEQWCIESATGDGKGSYAVVLNTPSAYALVAW